MEVTRKQIEAAFDASWCAHCKKTTDMVTIAINLPGVECQQCPECNIYFQVNRLESENDIMIVPDTYVFPSDSCLFTPEKT